MGAWENVFAVARELLNVLYVLMHYYLALRYYLSGGSLKTSSVLNGNRARQVHIYSLSKTLALWNTRHYRDINFRTDILKNLKNVCIPGTGLPLSVFCYFKPTAYFFVLVVYPLAAMGAAIYNTIHHGSRLVPEFEQQLLDPQHWFAIWRLNCLVVAYHSYLTKSQTYALEDKGTFLLEGDKAGIPVSPFLKLDSLVVKHKSIEGGMGLHFFQNFAQGGDWILQERLHNSAFISGLLPPGAPLSTLRVVTASRRWLMARQQLQGAQAGGAQLGSAGAAVPLGSLQAEGVEVVTVVFRAGLAGASTDHTSICFDVDRSSGVIGLGISNQHWYKLGPRHVGRVDSSASTTYTSHPDTGKAITGAQLPEFEQMLQLVATSHQVLVPDVPLVGWDVALTPQGACLLEINISCNFFNGSYDREQYVDFVYAFLLEMEQMEQMQFERRPAVSPCKRKQR